ncbi:hypothetical protein IQ07DRAFT_600258 [Pyrenochaeta sp. DS3sAY3a]|nr:hypothetical protein IQ07DRAFT_600258 [Pyrenochaeta sp. DS3sAY3a]
MDSFASPLRLIPPLTPRRAASPTMSPGGRRGRAYGSSEEGRLRDLSPDTTLRAFTQRPMPFDTTQDEYKIFACIDTLTAAERELGMRVAKAAQRLKSWCSEIEHWGWTGSFEQPSAEVRERRRKSLELRIREHMPNADVANTLGPLEYWGSMLSDEVKQHEARLDDIEEEMLKLDIEELKEHVLDMHPTGRSRPSSAGMGSLRQSYTLMDDFSFLITQTLLSALPHHFEIKERLSTWTARVSVLREAPLYLAKLEVSQRAMHLGWDAIVPPEDLSDVAFNQWKEAIHTISNVLQDKVGDLGRHLDRLLDTLEGREDCLPDAWIDTFEQVEADFGRWAHDSRRKIIDFDVRRKLETKPDSQRQAVTEQPEPHSDTVTVPDQQHARAPDALPSPIRTPNKTNANPTAWMYSSPSSPSGNGTIASRPITTNNLADPEIPSHATTPKDVPAQSSHHRSDTAQVESPSSSSYPIAPVDSADASTTVPANFVSADTASSPLDDESIFEEGDTVVHNEFEEDVEDDHLTQTVSAESFDDKSKGENGFGGITQTRPIPLDFSKAPVTITIGGQDGAVLEPPQTPRSRRGSTSSISSDVSFDSSPSFAPDSPSVRNTINRAARAPRPAPRPALNAAMAKRRPVKGTTDEAVLSPPWPPTQFTQPTNTTDDLEQKISDILTTIPAHIRLTSGPGADAPEVKSTRRVSAKGSRGYLRAARSISGLKSPELTLSPAKSEFDSMNAASGRKSAALRVDNDIKLYHLTQPGKEQPTKLFIRRVGENGERVMVRVGGGWADLGEYLRHFAEHHGRRTVSDGKFEILGLEVKNPDNSPMRPESALSKKDRRISGSQHIVTSPTTTPVKSSGPSLAKDEAPVPMPPLTSTPGIAEETSVPSTNSSQRSWQGNEVGLAGPKAKKLDLSGEKLEWIEGMMKQARTVSGNIPHATTTHNSLQREERAESRAESRSESRNGNRAGGRKSDFGDLGKVGGTKRIFLRGGQPYNFIFGDPLALGGHVQLIRDLEVSRSSPKSTYRAPITNAPRLDGRETGLPSSVLVSSCTRHLSICGTGIMGLTLARGDKPQRERCAANRANTFSVVMLSNPSRADLVFPTASQTCLRIVSYLGG